jgi:hypothetical protein
MEKGVEKEGADCVGSGGGVRFGRSLDRPPHTQENSKRPAALPLSGQADGGRYTTFVTLQRTASEGGPYKGSRTRTLATGLDFV